MYVYISSLFFIYQKGAQDDMETKLIKKKERRKVRSHGKFTGYEVANNA